MNLQKKSMLYLKSEVFYVYFFHFLLDIISRSRYHIISYQHIFHRTFSSFSVNWEITKLMSIWNEFNGFFLFFFFFYTVYKLDQAKLIKDPEWIYIYFKKTLPKKNPHNTERKKTHENSKGCKNFSRTHCYPWKIQQFWNLLASRWATSSILNHRTSRYHQPTEELV